MFAIAKHNPTGQVAAMNLDFFASSKEVKYLVEKALVVYLRTIEPASNVDKFATLQKSNTYLIYATVIKDKTIILVSSASLTEKDLIVAAYNIKKEIDANKSRFFICEY